MLTACHNAKVPEKYTDTNRPPRIYPDYTDVTIPVNIAPSHTLVYRIIK